MTFRYAKRVTASATLVALVSIPIATTPALASVDGDDVVINEIYPAGGLARAVLDTEYVALHNPTDAAIDLDGWSLQYRSATNAGTPTGIADLDGEIEPGGDYLVFGKTSPGNGDPVNAEADATYTFQTSSSSGQLILAKTTDGIDFGSEDDETIVADYVGYGEAAGFEGGAPAPTPQRSESLQRVDAVDTDDNAADFITAAPTLGDQDAGGGEGPTAPTDAMPISEITGVGSESPYAGQTVTTRGVVTAAYPTGNFNGYYIQTPGTGGALAEGHEASDAIFVYSRDTVDEVEIGDYVEVTGAAGSYNGLKQITVAAGGVTQLDAADAEDVTPAEAGFPADDTARYALQGMLLAPQGDYTVTDTYQTNNYGDVALAASDTPLVTPTVLGLPGTAEYEAASQRFDDEFVVLSKGSTVKYFNDQTEQGIPYLTDNIVRVGAAVDFTQPVILDFRNGDWKFQPTQALTVENADEVQPVEFENTRTAAPELAGGDVRLATFNVLNYFSTTGDMLNGCNFYTDRNGAAIAVSGGCDVRGAANAESFERQEAKIVSAITALDADVVSLEEIENSAAVGRADRDEALSTLVDALNEVEGEDTWDYAESPEDLPTNEDVIRTAFIYRADTVELAGESQILETANFSNAREPLAQGFTPVAGDEEDTFVVVANHLKSKGGSGSGDNQKTNDNIGGWNGDRTRQAGDVVDFAEQVGAELDTEKVFIVGDLNSYAAEDPIQVVTDAGYVDQGAKTGKHSYSYGYGVGSLDYVFASPEADAAVVDTDVWNINAPEAVALEYSRYNYNVTDFYAADPYRSSDHDPVVVDLDFDAAAEDEDVKQLNLLTINDFHGRIDGNTVAFAGTVEGLKAEYPDNTAFLSNGDNIGASLFESAIAQDQPTLDVLDALELQASAAGNHEFDAGYADLVDRVVPEVNFPHLSANTLLNGEPLLDAYEIIDVDGVSVAVIGAVSQETSSLVSAGGIEGIEFTDPVAAVNDVVTDLTESDAADVIVVEYHEGAATGETQGSTLEDELAKGGVFERMVNETDPAVDAIFTGHTHATYAWEAEIPGTDGDTRPVLQTGSYGENVGQVVLDYDVTTGETETVLNHNVPRVETPDEELVATYPAAAEVADIVEKALDEAAVVGNDVIGEVTAPITTAHIDGVRDDRASESTLGNLVADSMLSVLSDEERGGAEIGVINPGGLRADFLEAGEITYADANAVMPFANNLWTTTLTGEQFKTVLEQQWQRTAEGDVPSRPYLQLGLSNNVAYTFDPERAEGDRITSITVNGSSVDPEREYRIGSVGFLLEGSDNFHEFANGSDTKDSGLLDRDAWIEYLTTSSPVSPDYERRSVQVQGLPEDVVAPGDDVSLQFAKLDLTSLGVPASTEVTAEFVENAGGDVAPAMLELVDGLSAALAADDAEADAAAAFPVVDGAAAVDVTVPADATADTKLVVTANGSGLTIDVPLQIEAAGQGGSGAEGGSGSNGTAGAAGAGTSGSDSASAGSGTADSGTGAKGGSSLATTGSDGLLYAGVAAGMLLVTGGVILLARRARQRA